GNAVTEVPLLDEVDATTVKHEEDCLVQDSTLMRRDQVIGGGRRVNTSSSPSAAGPQAPNGARTTRRERKREDQCGASSSRRCSDVLAGSCMKKTTAMSAAQVVFCNTLVDRVCRKCGGLRRRLSKVPKKGHHKILMGCRLTERKALLVQVEKKRKQPAMMSDAGCE
ncbi:hypothetical protein BHM03_00015580, partial [Ensete ventricosum]